MAKKETLYKALLAKNDEFYTMLTDIEKEMAHYKDFFRGKTVYCNCDDARESNFFKYFSTRFEELGLKKLITTGYKAEGKGVVLVYEGDKNGNRKVDDAEVIVKELDGSGDFRSEECIEFLKEADVVVTNPPFSLFTEYIAQLIEYGKNFLIIGPLTAVGYKETFYHIKNNKVWLGMNHVTDFQKYGTFEIGKVPCRWFTNIDNKKRNTPIDLYKRYSNEYPHYANYDGIDCKAVSDIPVDYKGNIGVPISFLDNYCPSQFKIIGLSTGKLAKEIGIAKNHRGRTDLEMIIDGKIKEPFKRLIVKKLY